MLPWSRCICKGGSGLMCSGAGAQRGCTYVSSRRRPLTRLGLLLHIGFLCMTGRPLATFERILPEILEFVADHVGIPAPPIATWRAIYRRRMTFRASTPRCRSDRLAFCRRRCAANADGLLATPSGTVRISVCGRAVKHYAAM
ncbi:DUF4158 domain-containing protein, partial [Sphingobium sp. CCH11-B1]|uniref:DUF4158 domain-containing protein n=1 Tax=Sphingobium sp. CCH11-B1 TaxID=1768781 RepID=UPI0012E3F120